MSPTSLKRSAPSERSERWKRVSVRRELGIKKPLWERGKGLIVHGRDAANTSINILNNTLIELFRLVPRF